MSDGRVVIVGGGLAGIAGALDCARGGAQVTLVEVRPRLGGAAYSFERDGLWLDNGQHVFLGCCVAYRELLQRLGSSAQTILQDRLELPVLAPGRPLAWLRRSSLPAPFHLVGSLLRYRHLGPGERIAAVRAALALARLDPEDPEVDERSFGAWLAQRRQSPRAIEALWELIERPTLNLRVDEASLAAAAFVFRVGLLERPDAGDIGYARAPLQQVHGDAALRALTEAGVEVRLGWRAEQVEVIRDGLLTVAARGEALEAEAVVLAVPHGRVPALLPHGAVPDPGQLSQLGISPIVNLHVVYDRPVLDMEFAAAVGSPVQFVFDRTQSAGLDRGQCLAVSLSAASAEIDASADDLRTRFVAALAALLPAARDARVERFVVTRERMATFRAGPGARRLRPGSRTAIRGLALAGAWTDTGWPATMEGAVRSGHAAAHVALDALGGQQRVATPAALR